MVEKIDLQKHVSFQEVVASKRGRTYYFPWCVGALRLKPENLQTFENPEEAKAQGLLPSKNCKGLK